MLWNCFSLFGQFVGIAFIYTAAVPGKHPSGRLALFITGLVLFLFFAAANWFNIHLIVYG